MLTFFICVDQKITRLISLLCIFTSVIIPLIPSRQGGDASPSDPGIYYSSASTPTTEQQRNIAGQVRSNTFLSLEEGISSVFEITFMILRKQKSRRFREKWNFHSKKRGNWPDHWPRLFSCPNSLRGRCGSIWLLRMCKCPGPEVTPVGPRTAEAWVKPTSHWSTASRWQLTWTTGE